MAVTRSLAITSGADSATARAASSFGRSRLAVAVATAGFPAERLLVAGERITLADGLPSRAEGVLVWTDAALAELNLVGIDGGENLRRRLLSLGLRVGGEVEVVHRRGGGVVLARDGNRVALGHGVARKVLAEVIE